MAHHLRGGRKGRGGIGPGSEHEKKKKGRGFEKNWPREQGKRAQFAGGGGSEVGKKRKNQKERKRNPKITGTRRGKKTQKES